MPDDRTTDELLDVMFGPAPTRDAEEAASKAAGRELLRRYLEQQADIANSLRELVAWQEALNR
jgi:hypothetical protein